MPYGDDASTDASTDTLPTAAAPEQPEPAPTTGPAGSTRVAPPARPRVEARPTRGRPQAPRRARLAVRRLDPWSVFVLSLLVALFLGVVLVVAVLVLYSLLDSMGVLTSIDNFARDLQIISAGQTLIARSRVLGIAAVVAAVDVVLLTVLGTLFAFLYNLCASLTGGVEVTLAERD